MGILGNLFDFNRDGEMDTLEKATEFSFIMSAIKATEPDEDDDDFEENDEDEEW